MRELTKFENWVVSQIENLEKENSTLLRRSKIDRFKLHNLEIKVQEMEDTMTANNIT
jgi:hypothetical protein